MRVLTCALQNKCKPTGKYFGDPNTRLVQYFESKWCQILIAPEYWSENWPVLRPRSENIPKLDQISGFWMVQSPDSLPFENCAQNIMVFRWIQFLNNQYLDPHPKFFPLALFVFLILNSGGHFEEAVAIIIQWRSEIWPFKIRKHSKSGILKVGFLMVHM